MNDVSKAAAAGAAGALTTNVLHELTRRIVPDAPRVDLLGMQALSSLLRSAGIESPVGGRLYRLTLLGDLLSNAAYFALVATAPRKNALGAGAALGAIAGLGAVVLPAPLSLSEGTTGRTATTKALTVALYTAGGIAAALTLRRLAAPGA